MRNETMHERWLSHQDAAPGDGAGHPDDVEKAVPSVSGQPGDAFLYSAAVATAKPAALPEDVRAFARDLNDRLNWLFREVARLQDENDQLLKENRALREEVTLARLFEDLAHEGRDFIDLSAAVPREAVTFYQILPDAFAFTDFFQRAEIYGLDNETARDYLLLFYRENMLVQRGTHIEKCRVSSVEFRMGGKGKGKA